MKAKHCASGSQRPGSELMMWRGSETSLLLSVTTWVIMIMVMMVMKIMIMIMVMVGLFGDDVNDVGKAETYSWLKAGSPEQNK